MVIKKRSLKQMEGKEARHQKHQTRRKALQERGGSLNSPFWGEGTVIQEEILFGCVEESPFVHVAARGKGGNLTIVSRISGRSSESTGCRSAKNELKRQGGVEERGGFPLRPRRVFLRTKKRDYNWS